jgi:hypothetical protein
MTKTVAFGYSDGLAWCNGLRGRKPLTRQKKCVVYLRCKKRVAVIFPFDETQYLIVNGYASEVEMCAQSWPGRRIVRRTVAAIFLTVVATGNIYN